MTVPAWLGGLGVVAFLCGIAWARWPRRSVEARFTASVVALGLWIVAAAFFVAAIVAWAAEGAQSWAG